MYFLKDIAAMTGMVVRLLREGEGYLEIEEEGERHAA
jgi:hypothetical protein